MGILYAFIFNTRDPTLFFIFLIWLLSFHRPFQNTSCPSKHEAMSHNTLSFPEKEALRGVVRHSGKGYYAVTSRCLLGSCMVLNETLPIRTEDQRWPFYNPQQHHFEILTRCHPRHLSGAVLTHFFLTWELDYTGRRKQIQRRLLFCPRFNWALNFLGPRRIWTQQQNCKAH